jgi:PAS domain S-box-containing protein
MQLDAPQADTYSPDERADDAHSILRHTPFMLSRCSADLRYRYVSPAYARMIGHLPEEIVGRPIVEIMGQEGFNTILPYIERVLAGEQVEYETQAPFKGVGDRVLNVTYIPDHDAAGKVRGWIASIIDVTKKRQAEHRVAADLARLAAIVKTSDDAIVTNDLNGIITSWNEGAARLFGYTANEVIGKPVSILIPPDRSNEELSILERLRKGYTSTTTRQCDCARMAVS